MKGKFFAFYMNITRQIAKPGDFFEEKENQPCGKYQPSGDKEEQSNTSHKRWVYFFSIGKMLGKKFFRWKNYIRGRGYLKIYLILACFPYPHPNPLPGGEGIFVCFTPN
ncbi:MAG: hypothetical protein OEM01_11440 [Desulfobulbaceae bacterium]|nr:hypothetical protein [Desulfobulbaceae bacterium]